MKLSDISIRTKLRVFFILFLLFFTLFSVISLYGFRTVQQQFLNVKDNNVPDIIAILELKATTKGLFAEIQGFVASGDEGEIEEFREAVIRFNSWIQSWEVEPGDHEELALKNTMIHHKERFSFYGEKVFKTKEEQNHLLETFYLLDQEMRKYSELTSKTVSNNEPINNLHAFYQEVRSLQIATYKGLGSPTGNEEQTEHEEFVLSELQSIIGTLTVTIEQQMVSEPTLQLKKIAQEIMRVAVQLTENKLSVFELVEQIEEHEEVVLETVAKLVSLQNQEVQDSFQGTVTAIMGFYYFLIIIGGTCMFVAFLSFRKITLSIVTPISHLRDIMQLVSGGDLSQRAIRYGQDEIGQLTQSFNDMAQRLRTTMVSKKYVDNIFATMQESLVILTPHRTIQKANSAALDMLGYSIEELKGQEFNLVLSDKSLRSQELDHKTLFERVHEGAIDGLETHYITSNGQNIPVLFSASLMLDIEGATEGIVCVATNIVHIKQVQNKLQESYEDLQRTQDQLVQSSKLASIGELAAGVAHELNQPLMIIRTGGQLLERKHQQGRLKDEQLDNHLESLRKNSKRMMNIIDHLRTFSRQSSVEYQFIDVNEVIANSFYMIGEQLRLKNIEVTKKLSVELPQILGDANQIEQVILNLLANARDAILERVDIADADTENLREIMLITKLSEETPKTVEILVQDTGTGITKEKRDKVFDPFFTTKEEGKGTGLGLSISYGIIQDHQGDIDVVETSDDGTTFRVRLPISQKSI